MKVSFVGPVHRTHNPVRRALYMHRAGTKIHCAKWPYAPQPSPNAPRTLSSPQFRIFTLTFASLMSLASNWIIETQTYLLWHGLLFLIRRKPTF